MVLAGYSKAAQAVTAKLNFLPAGSYDVVDVTGERPLIVKDAAGQNHLASDPQYRRSFFVAQDTSADALKKTGLVLDVGARMSRVLLVRPAGEKVWVNCPEYELAALSKKPVIIVPGATPDEQNAAQTVSRALTRLGVKAESVAATSLKTRTVKNEVVVDNFKVDEFNNTPLEADTNLILIGSEATNPVIAKLGAEGTFCFDKVLMKVDGAFPGPGRGVIEVVESVSNEAYDATANSRDAIVIAGSDAAGVQHAVERFVKALTGAAAK